MKNMREPRPLPEALSGIPAFAELDPALRKELHGRMWFADLACANAEQAMDLPTTNMCDVLDSLECDALALSGASSHPDVDNWVIHNSWHIGLTKASLLSSLSPSLRRALNSSPPALEADQVSLDEWTRSQVSALRDSIEGFYNAPSPQAALAYKFCIDIILGLLAVAAGKMRFR